MGTNDTDETTCSIASALFGKTRRAVVGLLYAQPDEAFYLREILRATGVGRGALQRELGRLTAAGILRKTQRGRQVYYQANAACPVFADLRGLVLKTVGVADVLRDALARLAERIDVAFVHGSLAAGEATSESDVDLLVVGRVTFAEVAAATGGCEERLGRDVNPTVYPPAEFREKLEAGHHFLKTVRDGAKIFLIGDQHDVERLATGGPAEAS